MKTPVSAMSLAFSGAVAPKPASTARFDGHTDCETLPW